MAMSSETLDDDRFYEELTLLREEGDRVTALERAILKDEKKAEELAEKLKRRKRQASIDRNNNTLQRDGLYRRFFHGAGSEVRAAAYSANKASIDKELEKTIDSHIGEAGTIAMRKEGTPSLLATDDDASEAGACQRCRKTHAKCNGARPHCARCARERKDCVYGETLYRQASQSSQYSADAVRKRGHKHAESTALPEHEPGESLEQCSILVFVEGDRWVQLQCNVCGSNCSKQCGYLKGVTGMCLHLRKCHKQWVSAEKVLETCVLRTVPLEEVQAVYAGKVKIKEERLSHLEPAKSSSAAVPPAPLSHAPTSFTPKTIPGLQSTSLAHVHERLDDLSCSALTPSSLIYEPEKSTAISSKHNRTLSRGSKRPRHVLDDEDDGLPYPHSVKRSTRPASHNEESSVGAVTNENILGNSQPRPAQHEVQQQVSPHVVSSSTRRSSSIGSPLRAVFDFSDESD